MCSTAGRRHTVDGHLFRLVHGTQHDFKHEFGLVDGQRSADLDADCASVPLELPADRWPKASLR